MLNRALRKYVCIMPTLNRIGTENRIERKSTAIIKNISHDALLT